MSDEPDIPPIERLVGAVIMTGVSRAGDQPRALVDGMARAGTIGGVIITDTGRGDAGPLIRELQAAAKAGGNPRLIVAVDQEGGAVRRFANIGPVPAPAGLGNGPAGLTREQARRAGCALTNQGVTLDLAPVADAAIRRDGFIASSQRSFGTTPEKAAPHVRAFVVGLAQGGIASTIKHFPGLGTAGPTTDQSLGETISVVESPAAFRAGIHAGAAAVMISSATYTSPAFRSNLPAMVTSKPYRWLRTHGFDGVTITDDLSTPAIKMDRRLPEPAVQAIRAGADLVLFVDTTGRDARAAAASLTEAVSDGRLSKARLVDAWRRLEKLRQRSEQLATARDCWPG